jgi:ubiquitin-protein ligase
MFVTKLIMNKLLQKDFAMFKQYVCNTYESEDAVLFPILENCSLEEAFSDMNNFAVLMKGPVNSPYEGGIFKFVVTVPEKYPFDPPKVLCETKIYHPNITNKYICVETLKDGWSPSLGFKQLFMSIYAVMFTPNRHEGTVKEITEKDLEKHDAFIKKAANVTSEVTEKIEITNILH